MVVSAVEVQRDIIVDAIHNAARGQWKVLVVDKTSRKIMDNVVREDDILNANITNIEEIESRRQPNPDMDVVYLLSPEPHIVDCLLSDLDFHQYRSTYLLWTALPHSSLRERLDRSRAARESIKKFLVLGIDFYPKESHLVTFRDPWSFPIFFHPACNNLVRQHIEDISQKIVSVCVSLGEYPTIRYYKPRNPTHEASVLCSHIARFVQDQIDMYAQYHDDFPPQTNRPRGTLIILDRSIDLIAPLIHEFTYQAMAYDLLSIKEGDKTTYRTIINEGHRNEEAIDVEISERDKIWIENRHRHMKDTIEKLMGDFQSFMKQNPGFSNQDSANANSLNAIKDMLAGLPEFQEMKTAYSLHLSMAQECMNIFQMHKLPDLASVEQSLATGLDEDGRKPKNLADQVVRSLDDEAVVPSDRLRLIALYILYKNGILPSDLTLLFSHAQLPPQNQEILANLDMLGAKVSKALKENTSAPTPLFQVPKNAATNNDEAYALSRFTPALKKMLEEQVRGTLDQSIFPYTKPQLDATDGTSMASGGPSNASLRSAKPTWAKSRLASTEPRQRIILFMAGGATFSESRACYEVSQSTSRDVFLVTSHMQTPSLFVRQISDLSADKRRLGIPALQPKPKAPAHIFERQNERSQEAAIPSGPSHQPGQQSSQSGRGQSRQHNPPTSSLGNMSLSDDPSRNGTPEPSPASNSASSGKIKKDKEKEKKKHRLFGSK